mmetsp:Transcript_23511/g.68058  ORF Transcript_23511/g.68058 Transcript_23511/m.68058 type:complete len:320 (-) Transcript_23511:550-1509(-)
MAVARAGSWPGRYRRRGNRSKTGSCSTRRRWRTHRTSAAPPGTHPTGSARSTPSWSPRRSSATCPTALRPMHCWTRSCGRCTRRTARTMRLRTTTARRPTWTRTSIGTRSGSRRPGSSRRRRRTRRTMRMRRRVPAWATAAAMATTLRRRPMPPRQRALARGGGRSGGPSPSSAGGRRRCTRWPPASRSCGRRALSRRRPSRRSRRRSPRSRRSRSGRSPPCAGRLWSWRSRICRCTRTAASWTAIFRRAKRASAKCPCPWMAGCGCRSCTRPLVCSGKSSRTTSSPMLGRAIFGSCRRWPPRQNTLHGSSPCSVAPRN